MKRRRKLVLLAIILLVVLALCAILLPSGPPDPIYDGKHLSYWLTQRRPSQVTLGFQWRVDGPEPVLDHKLLDSNAIPYLVYSFGISDGPVRRKYAEFWPNLPGWQKSFLPKPRDTDTIRNLAMIYLLNLQAFDSPQVISAMTRMLEKGDDKSVRPAAAQFLGMSHSKDPAVIQALVHGLNDKDRSVRSRSTNALRTLDPTALTNAAKKL